MLIACVYVSVCKFCAEALELRIIRYRHMVEKYLSIFADVSNVLLALDLSVHSDIVRDCETLFVRYRTWNCIVRILC